MVRPPKPTPIQNATLLDAAEILIFAPHPDDETLACSGIIMQALTEGKRVQIVVFSNGDGYQRAAARLFRKSRPSVNSSDMLELGRFRQAEELAAMAVLGLQPTNVTFLGYPDGGLNQVYQNEGEIPYKQNTTEKTETYGLHQPDYHFLTYGKPAPYRKASALVDVTEIIQRVKPDQIYVTNEVDTHPDHQATFWFVRDAVKTSGYHGELYTYVIHAGSPRAWPVPLDATPQKPFEPPALVDGQWLLEGLPWPPPKRVRLTGEQAMMKLKALRAHQSQAQLTHLHLESFVKSEEIFWPVSKFIGNAPAVNQNTKPKHFKKLEKKKMYRWCREVSYIGIETYYRLSALFSKRTGLTQTKRNPPLIVSLTTIPERLYKVHLCIESLLRQSCKPDSLMLWVSFPEDKIPKKLDRLKKRGLQIKTCQDIRSYKKIIYTLKENPQSIIVTADDDIYYRRDWLNQLYEAYQKEPQYIHCYRAHLMIKDPDGKLKKYKEWNKLAPGIQGPSLLLFPTGADGVLYPPHSLSEEALHEEVFMRLSPYHDDAWLKAMSLLKGTQCKKVSPFSQKLIHIRGMKAKRLTKINKDGKGDEQIQAVFEYYNLYNVM